MSDNPTREKIQYELAEVLRVSYDSAQKEEKKLESAVNGLIEFFFHETQKTDKIPYQYKDVNQIEFYKHANVVSKALSQVEPVLSDMKSRMYNLEKGNQTMEQTVSGDQPQPMMMKQPEQKKPFINLPSFKKPRKPAPSLPYQSSLQLQKKTEAVIYNWELVIEYQAFGVDLADEFDREGINNYLTYHRNKFSWDIAPNILRIFKQGLELQVEREKKYALSGLTAQMRESFSMRNDMPNQSR